MRFYSEHEFIPASGFLSDHYTCRIDDERILVVWSANTGTKLRASVITYYGNNSINIASPAIFGGTSASTNVQDCVTISTDKVAIVYVDSSDGSIKIIIATISGSTVTLGTAQTVETPSNNTASYARICKVDTDKVAIIYGSATSISLRDVKIKAATISGTVATIGSATTLVTGAGISLGLSICSPATDKILYTYDDTSDHVLQSSTISGTTVSAGGTKVILSVDVTYALDVGFAVLSTDSVMAITQIDSTTDGVYAKHYTLSGTTITEAASLLLKTYGVEANAVTYAATIDSTTCMAIYVSESGSTTYIAKISVSGTAINVIDETELAPTSIQASQATISYLSAGLFVVTYRYDSTSRYFLLSETSISSLNSKRNIGQSLQVSWKKDFRADIIFFTIGVSLIGGNDLIAPSEAIDSQWNKYRFTDESDYLLSLDWEQSLNLPVGGLSQGLASGQLDNTTGRFTPRYLGGSSELYTAILPRRPFIINAGFENNGVDETDPQFVGLFTKQPEVDLRTKTLKWSGADFINFLNNRYVDNTVMYTGQRSDQLIETILNNLGYATSQYDLDTGINTPPFAIFNKGEKFGDIIHKITEAEGAQFYQDEQGILKFENRQHWDSAPYTDVQWEIYTSQVLDAKAPDADHIINVVEIKSKVREKQPEQIIFRLNTFDVPVISANSTLELFVDFDDPVLAMTTPAAGGQNSFYFANTLSDGTGTNLTSSISIVRTDVFAQAAKIVFRNSSTTSDAYLTQLVISGRVAKAQRDLYVRNQDDSSVTAYEERSLLIENDYIHEEDWAESFSRIILNDFAEPENLQEITIMAIPSLKRGDLISWQGRHWRVFSKKTRLDPNIGFIQDLTLLQRTVTSYFRIGISTIGGEDKIAP